MSISFRLQFVTQESVEGATIRNGHERIVAAGDEQTARLIANAMLGEEVAASEYLAIVEVVERTNEKPTLNCWTAAQEEAVWEKVVRKIDLAPDDFLSIYDSSRKKSRRIGLRITNPAKLTTKSST